jgi:hypothetical protein
MLSGSVGSTPCSVAKRPNLSVLFGERLKAVGRQAHEGKAQAKRLI